MRRPTKAFCYVELLDMELLPQTHLFLVAGRHDGHPLGHHLPSEGGAQNPGAGGTRNARSLASTSTWARQGGAPDPGNIKMCRASGAAGTTWRRSRAPSGPKRRTETNIGRDARREGRLCRGLGDSKHDPSQETSGRRRQRRLRLGFHAGCSLRRTQPRRRRGPADASDEWRATRRATPKGSVADNQDGHDA